MGKGGEHIGGGERARPGKVFLAGFPHYNQGGTRYWGNLLYERSTVLKEWSPPFFHQQGTGNYQILILLDGNLV